MKNALQKLEEIIFYYSDTNKFLFNVQLLAEKKVIGIANRFLKQSETKLFTRVKIIVTTSSQMTSDVINNYYDKKVKESHTFVQKNKEGIKKG